MPSWIGLGPGYPYFVRGRVDPEPAAGAFMPREKSKLLSIALERLHKVCDDEDEKSYFRDSGYLEIEPEWDSLRSDPRFKMLLKKLRLE
jgi:hypothetical protein